MVNNVIIFRLDLDNKTKEFLLFINGKEVETETLNMDLLGDLYLPTFPGKVIEGLPGIYIDHGIIIKSEFFFGNLIFTSAFPRMIEADVLGKDKLLRASVIIKRRKI